MPATEPRRIDFAWSDFHANVGVHMVPMPAFGERGMFTLFLYFDNQIAQIKGGIWGTAVEHMRFDYQVVFRKGDEVVKAFPCNEHGTTTLPFSEIHEAVAQGADTVSFEEKPQTDLVAGENQLS